MIEWCKKMYMTCVVSNIKCIKLFEKKKTNTAVNVSMILTGIFTAARHTSALFDWSIKNHLKKNDCQKNGTDIGFNYLTWFFFKYSNENWKHRFGCEHDKEHNWYQFRHNTNIDTTYQCVQINFIILMKKYLWKVKN